MITAFSPGPEALIKYVVGIMVHYPNFLKHSALCSTYRDTNVVDNHDYLPPLKRLSLQLWTFFGKIYFLFKSFVKVELSYVFTINLFTIAENCMKK